MADLSDVETAILAVVARALYPAGTGAPSVVGAPARVYRGWPVAPALGPDLRAGAVNVAIYATNREKNTTRYPREWQPLQGPPAPTLTLTVAGDTITVAGTIATPQTVAVIVDGIVAFAYAVQPTDTQVTIATALAALIAADESGQWAGTTSAGAVITVPGASALIGRAGTFGTSIRELKRQIRDIVIHIWANRADLRDQVASVLDPALAAVENLSLPDGTTGRLLYVNSPHSDTVLREAAYLRNLVYSVEYPTTETRTDAAILAPTVAYAAGPAPVLTTPIIRITS